MDNNSKKTVTAPDLPVAPADLDYQVTLIPCEWANLTEGSKMPVIAGVFATFNSTMQSAPGLSGILLVRHRLLIRFQKSKPGNTEIVVFFRVISCNDVPCNFGSAMFGMGGNVAKESLTNDSVINVEFNPLEGLPGVVINGENILWIRFEAYVGGKIAAWCLVKHVIIRQEVKL